MTMLHYPGHVTASLLVIVLVVFLAWAYRTPQWRQLPRFKALVPVLQLLPIIVLVLLLWDPARSQPRNEVRPNTVLAVFDTSESMSAEVKAGRNYLDTAVETFEQAFAPGADDRPAYRYYAFDGSLHEAADPRSLPRWGARTSIAPVLEAIAPYAPPRMESEGPRAVGAVIFTDGQMLEKSAAAAPAIASNDFKILVVGVGLDESRADLRVDRVDVPPRVRIDATADVQVAVSGSGLEGQPVRVELAVDGLSMASQDVAANTLSEGAVLAFRVPAGTAGVHALEARATLGAPEAILANNAASAAFETVEEPDLKVLFYSQWANFDIGKMRQVLEREKKVSLDFVLDAFFDDGKRQWVKGGRSRGPAGPFLTEKPIPRFPKDKDALFAYDIVILGPCDPGVFSAAQLDALYSFVAERGGGLLLFPGEEDFDLAQSFNPRIKAILPGECRVGPAPAAQPLTAMAVTPEGRTLGLAPLAGDGKFSAQLSTYYALQKKPAATSVVTLGEEPAIVSQRIGRGHVALLNLRHLYRLYREDQDGGPLRDLVSGLITHLGVSDHEASFVQLLAERAEEDPRQVTFTARVRDTGYQAAAGASVLLSVDDQVVPMSEGKAGEYHATVTTLGRETILARAEAALSGTYLGETTIATRLPLPVGELAHLERNRPFLEALAQRLGADYVDVENLGPDLAEVFPAVSEIEQASDVASAWRTWTWYGALCALLTAGWFVRRLAGMV